MDRLTDFFSIEELKIVRKDIVDYYNNKKNIYVIDTYDIINYTLPFVNLGKLSNDNKFALSTIFYENTFNIYDDIDLILANEYQTELLNIIDNLYYKIKSFPVIKQKLTDEITRALNDDNNENKEDKNLKTLFDNFELIIVLYIFIEKGKNPFEKFNTFIGKFSIETLKSKNIDAENCNDITEIFSNTTPSSETNNYFDLFIEDNKYKIASLKNDYERYCFLDNSYRDISVIDRVVNINRQIKPQINVHYLSSTPSKTKNIFKIIKENKINLHRNISQVFLLKQIISNATNKNKAIEDIDNLINLCQFEESIKEEKNNEESDSFNIRNSLVDSLQELIDTLKKDITNNYLYSSYDYYINLFDNIKSDDNTLKKESLNKILDLIDKTNIEIPDYLVIDKLKSKVTTLGQLQSLSNNLDSDHIQINTSEDIIKNTFHHLPYLLFNEIKPNDTIREFHIFLNKLSNSSSLIGNSTKMFSDELKSILKNMSVKKFTFKGQNVDSIILIYLNLITKSGENKYNTIDLVKSKLLLVDNSKLRLSRKDEKLNVIKDEMNEFTEDLHYLLIWLYRRAKRFDECVKIFDSNPVYKNKCRFNHGIALCYHSQAYEFIKSSKEKALNLFKTSKEHLLKAYELYERYQNDDDADFNQLVKKQQVAILNTIIDANLRFLEIEDKLEPILLQESREMFLLLKKILENKLPHIEYSSLETINHTESELDYYEALNDFNEGNFVNSIIRLNHSTENLKVVLRSKYLIDERFMEIESKINNLRYKNFKKLELL